MSEEKLLNVAETAKFLGVAPITVWRKLGTKETTQEIDHYRIGNRVLLSMESHILPYLKRCEQKAQQKPSVATDADKSQTPEQNSK